MSGPLVILPGAGWTGLSRMANQGFAQFLQHSLDLPFLFYGADQPWNGEVVYRDLLRRGIDPHISLTIVAFSAGVVGALQLSLLWPGVGNLIAIDGWCVPLGLLDGLGKTPRWSLSRLSHDLETHWNGTLFGPGQAQFYADPFVSHLKLWSDPQAVQGWGLTAGAEPSRITAGNFLLARIRQPRGNIPES